MASSATLLVLMCVIAFACGVAVGVDDGVHEQRVPRGLIVSRAAPLIAGQRNQQCTGLNGETGSCHSRRQCRQGNGTMDGQCGFASGVCCIYTLNQTTGNSLLKRTIIRRMATDTDTSYVYTVQATNPRICQVRVDINTLNIAQPVRTGTATACSAEFMQIGRFRLCGHSTNQHLYFPLSQTQNPTLRIGVTLQAASAGSWTLQVTQLECGAGRPTSTGTQVRRAAESTSSWSYTRIDRPEEFEFDIDVDGADGVSTNALSRQSQSAPRSTVANDAWLLAPKGCDQYFMNITDTVHSFNFDDALATNHQYVPLLTYKICINQPNNEQLRMVFDAFTLSRRITTANADAIENECLVNGLQTPGAGWDYFLMPRLTYQTTPATSIASVFCGTSLNGQTVTYSSSPYIITFATDNFIDGSTEAGWRFTYNLI